MLQCHSTSKEDEIIEDDTIDNLDYGHGIGTINFVPIAADRGCVTAEAGRPSNLYRRDTKDSCYDGGCDGQHRKYSSR